eukprot:scaffold114647_cov115-Cyclotella_meneghiniana.AAC.1
MPTSVHHELNATSLAEGRRDDATYASGIFIYTLEDFTREGDEAEKAGRCRYSRHWPWPQHVEHRGKLKN